MSELGLSAELVRSSADLVVLTLLKARPRYGYEILVTLGEMGDGGFRFKQGTLYPLLYRLEREGWVKAKWETPKTGKKRKVYTLTKDGRKVQAARVEAWGRFTKSVNAILKECDDE
jgi:PadR family transcriptional regulator PadR